MASSAKMGKKVISQNELRRIMNEQKVKLSQTAKKIESPLARYSAKGQLSCVLCEAVVASEGQWMAHLASKQHLANTRRKKSDNDPREISKRPAPSTSSSFAAPPEKKPKSSLPETAAGSSKSGVPSDFFDAKPAAPVIKTETKPKMEPPKKPPPPPTQSQKASTSKGPKGKNKPQVEEEEEGGDAIPEGFFDDPKLDAKVRNVEYKDPVEEEWDKFMKEMKEESEQSHQIIQDDQEEATAERQLEEIDEQMRNWSRVIDLEKKMDEVAVKTLAGDKIKKETDSDSGSDVDDEFDEFLDWRAKRS